MDQKRIGGFIKELRKAKGITQEQFAEILGVSGRTVSRWETGNNMPDISLLVEIAEFLEVSIPEIINGERKSEKMNEEVKEVAETLSDYASAEKETMIKDVRMHSIIGTCAIIVYCILDSTKLSLQNMLFEQIALYCETLALVTVLMVFAHTTGLISKIEKRKKKSIMNSKIETFPKMIRIAITAVVAFVGAAILKLFLSNFLGL